MKTKTKLAALLADCSWWFWFIGMWMWFALATLGAKAVESGTAEGFIVANRKVACLTVAAYVFWFFAERLLERLLDKELDDADDKDHPAG